jgi:hypothetical protein
LEGKSKNVEKEINCEKNTAARETMKNEKSKIKTDQY